MFLLVSIFIGFYFGKVRWPHNLIQQIPVPYNFLFIDACLMEPGYILTRLAIVVKKPSFHSFRNFKTSARSFN